jgi:MATE family multidrug resistance protein
MASNQGHYVGSLPNDYAILARFAHDDDENEDEDRNVLADAEEDARHTEVDRRAQSPRRSSFPSSYIRPPPPTIPSMNFKSGIPDNHPLLDNGATENTPLLGPLVPRIEEEQPGDEDDTKSNTTMFWEEMRILSKYTLPVFGSVSLFYLC